MTDEIDEEGMNWVIEKERLLIPYSDFWITANRLLDMAKVGSDRYDYYCLLPSLTFRAFALESFLNHIGGFKFPYWEDLENRLNVKSKLELICDKIDVDIEWGHEPWQVVPKLVGFRNKVAHGKTELLKPAPVLIDVQDDYEEILRTIVMSDWQETLRDEDQTRLVENTYELMDLVHKASGDDEPLLSTGRQSHSVKLKYRGSDLSK